MTQQEIEKKAFEAYPKPIRYDYLNDDDFGNAVVVRSIQRNGYIKALTEFDSLPKIHGWVARDSVEDGFIGTGLILHHHKPTRIGGEWSSSTIAMHLPPKMFRDLTWSDEPKEVELIIRAI